MLPLLTDQERVALGGKDNFIRITLFSSSSNFAATESSVTLLMIEEVLPSSVMALYPATVSKGSE